ncbi:hypothetical protein AB1Y20_018435 [Prymnesium parvum]|uniref:Glycosyltransferase 2-like domain-containing protein n=1 Tax=Prymnesium parvum TaxID=97485 RepID=A0AB34JR08_PRYPA
MKNRRSLRFAREAEGGVKAGRGEVGAGRESESAARRAQCHAAQPGMLPYIVPVLMVFGMLMFALTVLLCVRSRAKSENTRPQRVKLPGSTDSNETRSLPTWVWRVPFAVSGSAVVLCALTPLMYPVNFFNYANATLQIFLTYAVIYASIVVYGVRKIAASEAEPLYPSELRSSFYYAFIVPNYKESVEVLEATIANIADHPYAAKQFLVILAMEVREEEAQHKAERLCAKFGSQLRVMSYSLHQLVAGLECPGKASNVTAAALVLSSICRKERLSPSFVNVTVMDADTLISPRYHLRLDKMLSDWQAEGKMEKVNRQIFTPYMSFCNVDDRQIASIVAATDLTWGMTQIFHITRATPIRFAVSTYSLSLELLEFTGYWEVGDVGIGEDTHEALKVFFATDGEARTVPIYETFRCQCLSGNGFIDSCRQRYAQAARHALGHIDIGYTLHKCWTCTNIPIRLRFIAILQSFEIVYWMMGLMLGWGAALSTIIMWIATYTNPTVCYRGGTLERVACYHDVDNAPPVDPLQQERPAILPPNLRMPRGGRSYGEAAIARVFAIIWICVTLCQMTSAEWISAHHLRRTPGDWVRAILKWGTSPIVFILLFVLPALSSHWKLFKKEKLTYTVAPKSAGSTPANSCGDLEGLGNRSKSGGGSGGAKQLL